MKLKKKKYIVNGIIFKTFEEVETFTKENGYRITNTETIKKDVYLISITSIK